MMKDLLIVGAGPAGLLAGYTAAQKGLRVTIVDMKRDITVVNRACSAQFVLDEGYEGETLKAHQEWVRGSVPGKTDPDPS